MTKLEELIYSLATVIVRYHDTQGSVCKLIIEVESAILRKKSREYAIGIIQNRDITFNQQLKGLIDTCTKGYPDRKHFLTFILHEITFLKAQLARKISFKPTELEEYQQQITQLLIDFRQLLKTPKDEMCKVTYSALNSGTNPCIDLSGLINNAYFGNAFCNSGLLLLDEVLGRFHMTTASSDDEIREIAVSLCVENQNALLVSELQNQKYELESQESDFADKNKQQQEIIEKLRADLEETQNDLQKIRIEFQELKDKKQKDEQTLAQQKRTPIYSPLFSLNPYGMLQRPGTFNSTPQFYQATSQRHPETHAKTPELEEEDDDFSKPTDKALDRTDDETSPLEFFLS